MFKLFCPHFQYALSLLLALVAQLTCAIYISPSVKSWRSSFNPLDVTDPALQKVAHNLLFSNLVGNFQYFSHVFFMWWLKLLAATCLWKVFPLTATVVSPYFTSTFQIILNKSSFLDSVFSISFGDSVPQDYVLFVFLFLSSVYCTYFLWVVSYTPSISTRINMIKTLIYIRMQFFSWVLTFISIYPMNIYTVIFHRYLEHHMLKLNRLKATLTPLPQ